MFNLNDGRWGRGDDANQPNNSSTPPPEGSQQPPPDDGKRPRPSSSNGPPDLDELWRELSRKLNKFLGQNRGGGNQPPGGGGGFNPDFKQAGGLLGVVAGVVVLIWLGTGFFIVQEGQQAVITQFGRYHSTAGAGFNWRMPYPIQRHEVVFVTQIRSLDVGRDAIIKATGLRESAMLTEDENIVEIKFAVQYRLTDARAYLFESKNPTDAVMQAADTAVREVVGKMRMDAALSEDREQIAPRVRKIMQTILDQYNVGIEVVGINLQQGGVRPPEQVQAAFDDVLKAGQERERAKNEAEAYANDVIPRAVGSASRLKQEADAYKSRIVAQARGGVPTAAVARTEAAAGTVGAGAATARQEKEVARAAATAMRSSKALMGRSAPLLRRRTEASSLSASTRLAPWARACASSVTWPRWSRSKTPLVKTTGLGRAAIAASRPALGALSTPEAG